MSELRTAYDIEELYNTALLGVAERIQAHTFHIRCVSIAFRERRPLRIPSLRITPHVQAVYKLRRTLMFLLSECTTTDSVLKSIDQRALQKLLQLRLEELRAMVVFCCDLKLEEKRKEYCEALQDIGVNIRIADPFAQLLILRRDECIAFLNTSDDLGCPEIDVIGTPSR